MPALETYDTSSAPLPQQPPHAEALLPDAPIAPGLPLPQRAGFGKAGREVQLYANHFKLNSVQAEALLYAVDIRPPPPRGVTLEVAAGPQKLLPKQLSRCERSATSHLPSFIVVSPNLSIPGSFPDVPDARVSPQLPLFAFAFFCCRAVMQVATRGLGAACAYDGQLSLYATTHLEGDSSPEGIVIQVDSNMFPCGVKGDS